MKLKYAGISGLSLDELVAIVSKDGYQIQNVSTQTNSVCLAAVAQNGDALKHVEPYLRTEAVCLAAVQQNGHALRFVFESNRTAQLELAAVTKTGDALQYVVFRTDVVNLAAVKQDGYALKHVGRQTEEICRAAIQQNPAALSRVRDREMFIQMALEFKIDTDISPLVDEALLAERADEACASPAP